MATTEPAQRQPPEGFYPALSSLIESAGTYLFTKDPSGRYVTRQRSSPRSGCRTGGVAQGAESLNDPLAVSSESFGSPVDAHLGGFTARGECYLGW